MNKQANLTGRFLMSVFAFLLRSWLTPLYYVMRSDMGIQFTGVVPTLIPSALYVGLWQTLRQTGLTNTKEFALCFWLVAMGYVRNTIQARRRRRVRDWSVHSWSTGQSLLKPVFTLAYQRSRDRWPRGSQLGRLRGLLVSSNFIHYVAEPFVLLLFALGLYSIGSVFFCYPVVLAVALIVVRNESQLHCYLLAHEVMDGKMLEQEVKWQLEGPGPAQAAIPVAQIAGTSSARPATDDKSVFDRLSPELQLLLMRDRAVEQQMHFKL